MIDTSTVIEAVCYLLKELKSDSKLKLLKLVYLADKYHLLHYGRTVTGDEYWAMEHGPVASTVKDVLELNDFSLSPNELKKANELFTKNDERNFTVKEAGEFELESLSETDIEALKFALDNYGKMSPWELREYSHKFPEWHQYKDLFENGQTKREKIDLEELLSTIPDDPVSQSVSPEHIEETRRMITGHF